MTGIRAPGRSFRTSGRRGLTTVTSAIVIVVVLALLGVSTYAVMGGFSKTSNPTSCWPPSSPICGQLINPHDLTLLIPFRSVQQGQSVPFTATLPAGETATSYSFHWGDSTFTNNSKTPTVSHNFTSPGVYLVEATAPVNGIIHDSIVALQQIAVTPTVSASNAGTIPSVAGYILANTTTPVGGHGASAVLSPGGSLTVSGTYTSAPTNPAFLDNAPKIVVTTGPAGGASLSNSSKGVGNTSAGTIGKFTLPGTYTLTFVGSASNGASTAYQNYTWTVFVAPVGVHAGLAVRSINVSPHPGVIQNYELIPGGAASEDPAIDYETAGAEPIYNVYQTLITYNGSLTGPDPTDFVPELATCVPGSEECQALYGDPLVHGWNYTFVISGNASFYDGLTHAHWGVYPSDVVFSIARTLGFSTLPCVGCNNGWIIGQALLNPGNTSWDLIHGAYNNTPGNILDSMSVNGSGGSDCPAAAIANDHGCVTFHAYGNKHLWPFFLELIADPLGGGIVSCGWFSSNNQGAGIPYWTANNVTDSGDHPCGLPGTPGYGAPSSIIPLTGWDRWEQLGSGAFGTFLGHVQYGMLGSGPYYMSTYDVGTSYTLQANPYYGQNPDCTWTGCEPASGRYASTVEVVWETSATPGEQAYAAGIADHASIPSSDLSLLLQLIQQGKAVAISAPTLTIGFEPFNLNINLQGAQHLTTSTVNIPSDWFSYQGMRQWFIHSYPYATVQKTIQTQKGIELGFGYGGAIPQFMANYYPTNIPWPSADPCTTTTDPSCAGYWWAQMQNRSSPFFDPEVLHCSANSACQFPLVGSTGSPTGDQINALWSSEVSQLSGGAIKISPVDLNFNQIIVNSNFAGAGQNPMPLYGLGWAPDYPDPTDYVVPLYLPNATYTFGDAVIQGLLQPQFTTGCTNPIADYNYYANSTFPQSCQGVAYKSMVFVLNVAAITPPGPYRILLYDLAEKIAYQLGLYLYTGQSNQISSFASWMDPTSINTNVTIGGGGDDLYFDLTGNSVQYRGST
ncbi:MAG: ABC transporter substrate-binding protein [Thermoplasmata archaeon]|nr:ABC transporter substrate-binding protein [Thermoplasmata archaeon]